MPRKIYIIENLDCANCAAKIEKKFNDHPQVQEATITFATKQLRLTAENPDYADILCLCEDISKAEVLEAIRRGAVTVDGVKRRTGCAMGRCQGGRCTQKIEELLNEFGENIYDRQTWS